MSNNAELIERVKVASKNCPDGKWDEILSRLIAGTDTDEDAGYVSANLSDCV